MNINLDNDQVEFKDESFGRAVWLYKNGNVAVKITDPHSTYPASGTLTIWYTTGDVLTYIPNGDEYKLIRIITGDGIVWNYRKPSEDEHV